MPQDKYRASLTIHGPARDTQAEADADMIAMEKMLEKAGPGWPATAMIPVKRIPGSDAVNAKSIG